MKRILNKIRILYNALSPDRFAREPWHYRRKATSSERAAQAARESAWREQGDCYFSEDVYVSPGATVNPRHLVLGVGTSVGSETQIGVNLEMGARCTVNAGAVVRGKIKIGDDVRIATGAQILGFNHGFQDLTKPIHEQPITRTGIVIGDDVWVGANAVVLDGVKIGSHAIIGAGAIVTKNIPSWSVAVGNPASVIRSRKYNRLDKNSAIADAWCSFGDKLVTEMPVILQRSLHNGAFVDFPGDVLKTRPWADVIELATMTDTLVPYYNKKQLIDRLRSFQDPVTGLVPGPYAEGRFSSGGIFTEKMECRHSAYMVMAIGYALECLGSHLQYPVDVAAKLQSSDLLTHLSNMPWDKKAWSCGAWIDHFASACYFNARYHGINRDMSDLVGWLQQHADPNNGMWGKPCPKNDWLQPVNGFYRLTRGAHAQFGWALPNPEQTIDTVITHSRDQEYFGTDQATACFVLDVVHPLWLCLKQTNYRRAEAELIAQFWLMDTINRWQPNEGLSFETGPEATPRLQGTEMWLSIAWYCADLLGVTSELDAYRPSGVHRPEVMAPLYSSGSI